MEMANTEQPLKDYIDEADLYWILDVTRDATVDVIRAAYKKLAGIHHPDKGGATLVFKIIKNAYDILKDPIKRQQYDTTGKVTHVNIAEAARAMLISGIHGLINNEHNDLQYADIIEAVEAGVSGDILQVAQEIGKQERALERLVKNKNRASGIIVYVFEESIKNVSTLLAGAEQTKEILEAALVMIEDSSYEFDVRPEPDYTTFNTGGIVFDIPGGGGG